MIKIEGDGKNNFRHPHNYYEKVNFYSSSFFSEYSLRSFS